MQVRGVRVCGAAGVSAAAKVNAGEAPGRENAVNGGAGVGMRQAPPVRWWFTGDRAAGRRLPRAMPGGRGGSSLVGARG